MKDVLYTVRGRVERGYAQAGKQGYPTANLKSENLADIPHGIYCGWTQIGPEEKRIPSIIFYGIPYSLPGVTVPRFEVHLFSGQYDLYEKELTVEITAFMRANQKFDRGEDLQKAIEDDVEKARGYFAL